MASLKKMTQNMSDAVDAPHVQSLFASSAVVDAPVIEEEEESRRDRKRIQKRENRRQRNTQRREEEQVQCRLECRYFFANGLRFIVPYEHTFYASAKTRWIGRTLVDVFTSEFVAYSRQHYEDAIRSGHIRVLPRAVQHQKNVAPPENTTRTITPVDYCIRDLDRVAHTLHRHEVPVSAAPINILYETPELIIVDKPASMPIHPCGKYRYNSLLYILEHDLGERLYSVHRLDRLTSGLVLLARSSAYCASFSKQLFSGRFTKQYVARVLGEFPAEPFVVDAPIGTIDSTLGICGVVLPNSKHTSPNVRTARTLFHRLSVSADRRSSLVLCQPVTGRTHQLRVHLQWCGHPIVNDPDYGGALRLSNSDRHPSAAAVAAPLPVERTQCSDTVRYITDEMLKDVHMCSSAGDNEEDAECNSSATEPTNFDSDSFRLPGAVPSRLQQKVIDQYQKRIQATLPAKHDLRPFRPCVSTPEWQTRLRNDMEASRCRIAAAHDPSCTLPPAQSVSDATDPGNLCEPSSDVDLIRELPQRYRDDMLSIAKQCDESTSATSYDEACDECRSGSYWAEDEVHSMFIYLHAWRYAGPDWRFEVPLPAWASDEFAFDAADEFLLASQKDGAMNSAKD